ncbi:MAG: VanW family protein [Patescibacteria group bacterium]|jgi:vancomycin resistance protein YoaR
MKRLHSTKHTTGWLIIISLILLATLFYWVWDVAYAGRVFPGVFVGETRFGGQTLAVANQTAKSLVQNARKQELVLEAIGFSESYLPEEFGIIWAPETIAQSTIQFGRSRSVVNNLYQRLRAALVGATIPAIYQEQLDKTDQIITKLRRKIDQAGVDSEVLIESGQAVTKPAVVGKRLDEVELGRLLQQRWQRLNFSALPLPISESLPVFDDGLAKMTADKINQSLATPYTLVLKDREIILSTDDLWKWIEVVKQNNSFLVHLRPNDLAKYLQDMKTSTDQPVQDASLTIKDKKVTKFQPDQLGISVQVVATAAIIQASLLTDQRKLEVAANYVNPKVRLSELNDLGINELVARGESNFAGSPNNRRHNIKTGAAKFDKVLVAPEEKFSFNKTLGEVSGATGYLPELVIKGDATTPEFGGGLCQVSTTAFRAALQGGYPILARKNHSYRVSYYEPAGTDATVYQPYPDMQFLNDSQGHILIHTRVEGDKLYFDFYGTKTGQRVELEGPRIFNITEPPAPVYIETSTLPEGSQKKIDTAHRGADTVLYRHIYNESGREIRKDTFKSHYVPWPAKYLVGAKAAPPVETNLGNVPPETTAKETTPVTIPPNTT